MKPLLRAGDLLFYSFLLPSMGRNYFSVNFIHVHMNFLLNKLINIFRIKLYYLKILLHGIRKIVDSGFKSIEKYPAYYIFSFLMLILSF